MAHLVRQKKTYHVNAAGARVPAGTTGAKKVTELLKKWYAAGVPGFPPRKRIPLATDKRVAQKMLADLIERGERGEVGLADKGEAATALEPLLAGFEAAIARRSKPKHTAAVLRNVRRVQSGCGMRTLADLRAADAAVRVESFVWAIADGDDGLTSATAAYAGKHVKLPTATTG